MTAECFDPDQQVSGACCDPDRQAATPADPHALVGELMSRTAWTPERLADHQREQLVALLRHAVTASPYYRRVLGTDAADVPLSELPSLPKAALMEHFDEIVTDPRLHRADLEAHLAGPAAAEPVHDHLVLSTSGSTGLRGLFVYSRPEFAQWVAALLRTMSLFGITPTTRLLPVAAPSPLHISRHLAAGLTAGRDVPRLSLTTPMPEIVSLLNAYQPEAMPSNASMHGLLAEEQIAGRLRISPRIVAATGEVLTGDMRDRIREAWGIEPHDFYAATEATPLASSCSAQVGMHLWEDLALVEVVDEHNRPVPPGVPGHKILLTNLVNHTQPLIRYEISDSVALADGPDPNGWPFRRIAAVEGRSDDILDLPVPGGGTVAVHPLHLRAPFAPLPDVVQYQVVHDRRGLSVWVVLRDGAPPDMPERVRSGLVDELVRAGALPPPITVTPVTSIDREAGGAAKFKIIKSELGRPQL